MALNTNHQAHLDMMSAFEKAEAGSPRDATGRASYGMAQSSGLPRSQAQMASANKAAKASALARGQRAVTAPRSPVAPVTPGPAAKAAGPLKAPAGVSTGGLGLAVKPKAGLLG